jgi:hypothetical protein
MFKIEAKVGQKYDLWAEKLKTNNAMVRMEVKRISNKHGHLFFAITSTENAQTQTLVSATDNGVSD